MSTISAVTSITAAAPARDTVSTPVQRQPVEVQSADASVTVSMAKVPGSSIDPGPMMASYSFKVFPRGVPDPPPQIGLNVDTRA